jgi:Holliday junction resolvase-like predicted endonuclease
MVYMFHMKRFTSVTQKRGELGEKIALKFLLNNGFGIIETNYTKKVGEIDIVAMKHSIIHFVEVKTIINDVSRGTLLEKRSFVSRETYSPFQNLGKLKLHRFGRTCEWYLSERRVSRDTKWQIDAVAVIVSRETRSAKVEVLWNVTS